VGLFLREKDKFLNYIREYSNSKSERFTILEIFPNSEDLKTLLNQADELKRCLDSFRPLQSLQVEKLESYFDELYTYDSNRIEGNTLTLQETSLIINRGITIQGKPLREHLEVINHIEAIEYIKDITKSNIEFNERALLNIHYLVLKSIQSREAGKYRNCDVLISGSRHTPASFLQLDELMSEYFKFYIENRDRLHPIILSANMHERLVTIHPFIDGNGRTSRLVMNFLLLKSGYLITNISADEREDYYKKLEKSQVDNQKEGFYIFIAKKVKNALIEYLNIIALNAKEDNKGAYFYKKVCEALKL